MDHQNWEPVVLKKRQQRGGGGGGGGGSGGEAAGGVPGDKKYNAGTNKASAHQPQKNTRKLDEETDANRHETVSQDLKVRIMKARQAKGWSQKQLATAINEKQSVVNEYESGKAIPNNALLGKMERALGMKLRGPPAKK
eukprot:Rmarinus@m.3297